MIGQRFQSNRAWPADKHAGDVGECVLFYESLDPRYDLFVLEFADGKREVYHRKELTWLQNEHTSAAQSALPGESIAT